MGRGRAGGRNESSIRGTRTSVPTRKVVQETRSWGATCCFKGVFHTEMSMFFFLEYWRKKWLSVFCLVATSPKIGSFVRDVSDDPSPFFSLTYSHSEYEYSVLKIT